MTVKQAASLAAGREAERERRRRRLQQKQVRRVFGTPKGMGR